MTNDPFNTEQAFLRAKLNAAIDEGRGMVKTRPNNQSGYRELVDRQTAWIRSTCEFLQDSFEDPRVAEKFLSAQVSELLPSWRKLEERLNLFRANTSMKVDYLEELLSAL